MVTLVDRGRPSAKSLLRLYRYSGGVVCMHTYVISRANAGQGRLAALGHAQRLRPPAFYCSSSTTTLHRRGAHLHLLYRPQPLVNKIPTCSFPLQVTTKHGSPPLP